MSSPMLTAQEIRNEIIKLKIKVEGLTSRLAAVSISDIDASQITTGTKTSAFISDFDDAADERIAIQKGQANGLATLGADGVIPSAQLPGSVDEILEYANLASFPGTGVDNKIYLALDTGFSYRWSGSTYVRINGNAVTSVFGRTGDVVATSGDYTTAQLTESTNKKFVTDADLVKLGNLSGTNTGDQTNIPGNAATVTTINGRIAAGANITLSGSGTAASPYTIASSSGGTDIESKGVYIFDGDRTGTTDVVDDLEAFMEAHEGSTIYLPSGLYKLSRALNPTVSVFLKGAGRYNTILLQNKDDHAINNAAQFTAIDAAKTQQSVSALGLAVCPDGYATSTDTDWTVYLEVTNASGFKIADDVFITSSDTFAAYVANRADGKSWTSNGESARIAYVDTAVTPHRIYLTGQLSLLHTNYTTNVYVTKIPRTYRFEISDLAITHDPAEGAWDDQTIDVIGNIHNISILLYGVPEAKIENVFAYQLWEGFVQLELCPFSKIHNCLVRQLVNLGTDKYFILGTDPFATNSTTNSGGNTTITVTQAGHPWAVGDTLAFTKSGTITGGGITIPEDPLGITVTAVTTNTFSFVMAGTPTTVSAFGGTGVEVGLYLGRLGYGFAIGVGCGGTVISDCEVSECRHGLTTVEHPQSTANNSSGARWYLQGVCNRLRVTNCQFHGSYGPPIDTHEGAFDTTIEDCTVHFPARGPQAGSYRSYGVHFRGGGNRLINYTQYGGQTGVRISSASQMAHSDMSFDNCKFYNLVGQSDAYSGTYGSSVNSSRRSCAILVEDFTDLVPYRSINVKDLYVEDALNGVATMGGDTVYNMNFTGHNQFIRCGVPIDLHGGVDVTVDGPTTFDFRDTTRTPTLSAANIAACVRLGATNDDPGESPDFLPQTQTGAIIRFLTTPIVKKNSAGYPISFFWEADTVATKQYYLPGNTFTEFNPDGVTPTTLLSSGATTLIMNRQVYQGNVADATLNYGYPTGRWFGPIKTAALSTTAIANSTSCSFTPFEVGGRGATFSEIGCIFHTNSAATAARLGVYTANGINLGELIAQVEVTGISTSITTTDTAVKGTFSSPIFLPSGKYYLALMTNNAVSLVRSVEGRTILGNILGMSDLLQYDSATGIGRREITGLTYSGGLPAAFSTTTSITSSTAIPWIALKVQ